MQKICYRHVLHTLLLSFFTVITVHSQSLFAPLLLQDKQEELKWNALRNNTQVTVLGYNSEVYKSIQEGSFEQLNISIPSFDGDLYLRLTKNEIFDEAFKVSTEKEREVDYQKTLHYVGKIEGQPHSTVALSFFDNEVTGIINNEAGNKYVIGKSPALRGNKYILFDETKLTESPATSCGAELLPNYSENLKNVHIPKLENRVVGGCVKIFFELGNSVYTGKGNSVQAATDYIAAAFNVVKTLYANDGINVVISEVKVWTTVEPYSTGGSSATLNSYCSIVKTNFNGNIAQFIRMKSSGGFSGIAWLDVLCSNYFTFGSPVQHVAPVSYSEISPSFNAFPSYSWTVTVIAHELGHNLGSPHTHDCSWPGGPIDNCASAGCSTTGPTPTNGGTIMSYCHLTGVGINFNNGFGPQPKALIQNRVNAAACAVACTGGTTCTSPVNASSSNITTSSATISWGAVSGAANYDVQYRVNGSTTWINAAISTTSTSVNLSGLSAATVYQWQVRANCGSSSSAFVVSNFTTQSSTPTACNAPTNLASSTTSNSANVSWAAVSGAVNYTVQYRTSAVSTWTTWSNTLTTTSATITGLTASTAYQWQVRTNCSSTSSAFSQSSFTTIAAAACAPPSSLNTTNITTTTCTISWVASSSAFNYTVDIKLAGSTTWTNLGVVSGTAANISGLTAGTTYDWRLSSNCSSGISSYVQSQFTTVSTTPVSCNAPSTLTMSNVASTTATATWASVSGASNYTVELKTSTSSTWTNIFTTSGLTMNFTGLAASTGYNIRVKTNCSSGSSTYIQTSFTTQAATVVCNAPTSLTVSSITASGSSLSWPAVSGATNYTVELKTRASSTWTNTFAAAGTTLALSGLTASTLYDVRIKTNCGTSSSVYTSNSFTTAAAAVVCNTPASITTSNITTSTATLSWPAVSGATNYTVEYKLTSISTWIIATTTATSQSITNLQPGSAYDCRVKTNCGTSSSTYVQNTFNTTATTTPCPLPTGLSTSNITNSSATVNWQSVSGAINYTVEYKLNTSATWIVVTSALATTSFALSGLTTNSLYDWRVKSNCSSTASAYATGQFTTLNTSATTCPGTQDLSENGTLATAASISLNTNIKGTISPSGDIDHYKFEVSGAGSLSILLTNLAADYDLRLYNAAGGALATSQKSGTINESIAISLTAGTYIIRVYGWSGANNASVCYDLRIQTGTATIEYEENKSSNDLMVSVYPNPVVNHWLNYEIENMMGMSQVQVVDLQGRTIYTEVTKVNANKTNVSRLLPGFYFLRIQDEEKRTKVVKFLKSH